MVDGDNDVTTLDHIKLWLLAERFSMPRLQNKIVEKHDSGIAYYGMVFYDSEYTGEDREQFKKEAGECLKYVTKHVPEDCALRGLAVDSVIYCLEWLETDDIEECIENIFPSVLTAEVLKKLLRRPRGSRF